jgi:hypothetical protein
MPESDHIPEGDPKPAVCKHDFQLEAIGGAYLTGAYICRHCDHRVVMSQAELRGRKAYPHQYQSTETAAEPEVSRGEGTSLSEVPRSDTE